MLSKSTNISSHMKLVGAVCHWKYSCHLLFVPCNRNSPGFDLTELWIGYLHMQGDSRHPYAHLQLCAQVAVGEVHHHPHSSTCLLAVNIHRITPLRHLCVKRAYFKFSIIHSFLQVSVPSQLLQFVSRALWFHSKAQNHFLDLPHSLFLNGGIQMLTKNLVSTFSLMSRDT